MQINTELNPGEKGFFLVDNNIIQATVEVVNVEAEVGEEVRVVYSLDLRTDDGPRRRAYEGKSGKTKEALLAKL